MDNAFPTLAGKSKMFHNDWLMVFDDLTKKLNINIVAGSIKTRSSVQIYHDAQRSGN